MKVSVIVPTLNEEGMAARAVRSAVEADEIVVVDGGSVDGTRRVVERLGVRVVSCAPGRGRQLAHGAEVATGDVLVFLHADTVLPVGFRDAVCSVLQVAEWGRFDLRFDGGGLLLAFIARLISIRSRLSRVATGDQGIFATRRVYDAAGGFREAELFEDIDLCRRLKRLARMGVPSLPIVTSPRRWKARGTWRTTFLMWGLKTLYLAGVPANRLARYYPDVR